MASTFRIFLSRFLSLKLLAYFPEGVLNFTLQSSAGCCCDRVLAAVSSRQTVLCRRGSSVRTVSRSRESPCSVSRILCGGGFCYAAAVLVSRVAAARTVDRACVLAGLGDCGSLR